VAGILREFCATSPGTVPAAVPRQKIDIEPPRAAIWRQSVAKWPRFTIKYLVPGDKVLTMCNVSTGAVPDDGKMITDGAVLKTVWNTLPHGLAHSANSALR